MKKQRQLILVASIFAFTCFLALSFLVHNGRFERFDINATVLAQTIIPKNFDLALSLLSLVGSFEVILILLALLLFLFLRKKKVVVNVVLLFLFAHLIELFGKTFLSQIGPSPKFFRYAIPFVFPTSSVQPGNSYPSGHSLRIVFLAVIFTAFVFSSHRFSKSRKMLFSTVSIFVALLMLLSRVSLGEHWATDVIGGSFLGLASGLLSIALL